MIAIVDDDDDNNNNNNNNNVLGFYIKYIKICENAKEKSKIKITSSRTQNLKKFNVDKETN